MNVCVRRYAQARVQTYHKLLKLEGRLDLALSQVAAHKAGASAFVHEPQLLVQEVSAADMVIGEEELDDDQGESSDDEGEDQVDDMDL